MKPCMFLLTLCASATIIRRVSPKSLTPLQPESQNKNMRNGTAPAAEKNACPPKSTLEKLSHLA